MSDPVWLPWAARALWLSLVVTSGSVLLDDLDARSTAVRLVGAVLWWGAWGLGVLAALLPRPAGLTWWRVSSPALAGAALVAANGTGEWVIAGVAALTAALSFLPEAGAWLVNGAAYGYERRHLLRPPVPLLLGPIPVAGVVAVVGIAVGPLLLAARQWVTGAIACVVGAALTAIALRALHQLTQRWAVLVPAGLVLKDHIALVDPVLFRRVEIRQLAAADAASDALDLTASAPGPALELQLLEPAPLVVVDRQRPGGQPVRVQRLLFSPTRPGAVLADAASRRIPVDVA